MENAGAVGIVQGARQLETDAQDEVAPAPREQDRGRAGQAAIRIAPAGMAADRVEGIPAAQAGRVPALEIGKEFGEVAAGNERRGKPGQAFLLASLQDPQDSRVP